MGHELAILAELMPHGGTAIAALGKNTSWGTDIEARNVLFLPR